MGWRGGRGIIWGKKVEARVLTWNISNLQVESLDWRMSCHVSFYVPVTADVGDVSADFFLHCKEIVRN